MSCSGGWIKAKHFHIGLRQKHKFWSQSSIIPTTPRGFSPELEFQRGCFPAPHKGHAFSGSGCRIRHQLSKSDALHRGLKCCLGNRPWGSKIDVSNGCLCYLTQHTYNRDKLSLVDAVPLLTLASSANKPVT